MSRIFIYDASPDRIRTLYHCLSGEGHDVVTNMANINGSISRQELDPVRAVRELWVGFDGEMPDVILTDCLDVDSEKFLEELNKPFKKDVMVIVMTEKYPNANSRLKRLMANFDAFCIERPLEVQRFLTFVQESTLAPVNGNKPSN